MEQRVTLITLGVADLGQSFAFYQQLGWRGHEVEETVFFQAGEQAIVLWGRDQVAADAGIEDDGKSRFGGIVLAHNVASREEVDRIVGAAASAGAEVTKVPSETFYGGYAGFFRDPDGHVWEVAHNPGFGLSADGALDTPRLWERHIVTDADFDVGAAVRRARCSAPRPGLSWRGVADEITSQASGWVARLGDAAHPLSPATLSGMRERRSITANHASGMLLWLGRTPESFVPGCAANEPDAALPQVGPDRILRWDSAALHTALDAQRRARRDDVAAGCARGSLQRRPGHRVGPFAVCPRCRPRDAHGAVARLSCCHLHRCRGWVEIRLNSSSSGRFQSKR